MKPKAPPFRKTVFGLALLSLILPQVCFAQAASLLTHHVLSPAGEVPPQGKQTQDLLGALKLLEKRFDVIFDYNRRELKSKTTSLAATDLQEKTIEQLLQQLLPPLELSYEKYNEKSYLIYSKRDRNLRKSSDRSSVAPVTAPLDIAQAMAGPAAQGVPSAFAVSGRVTDEKGEGLPGVTVVLKGTTTGTTTDGGGNYRLELPDGTGTLVFSFIGYMAEEVAVGNRSTVDIRLVADIKSLGEVVVVGYGTQRKTDLTGAVSSIKTETLKEIPVTSVDQFIQGRAAGVMVQQNSGAPGSGTSIRIRGNSSINSSSEPLYVIDGYPFYPDNTTYSIGSGQRSQPTNALASFNPGDIESIEVLKDASATAIYGSRGANGVILITTKRGKAGTPVVEYNVQYGVQQVTRTLDVLSARDYAIFQNTVKRNQGQVPVFNGKGPKNPSPDQINFPGTDWQDEIFRQAPISGHNLSVRGGTDNVRYAVSANYFNQQGILLNSGFQRLSLRSNLDMKVSEKLSVGVNIAINRNLSRLGQVEGVSDKGNAGAVSSALLMSPLATVRDSLGNYNLTGPFNTAPNPVVEALENKDRLYTNRMLSTAFARYELAKNLRLQVSVSGDVIGLNKELYRPRNTVLGKAFDGVAYRENRNITNLLNENILTYDLESNRHTVGLLAGYTYQTEFQTGFAGGATNFGNDLLEDYSFGSGAKTSQSSSFGNDWGLASYIGRVNYSYNGRYLLTLTGRFDGSSKFSQGNKWGFFPSVAAGWRISEEPFMKPVSFVSNLKLRASYGFTGNSSVPGYRSLSSLKQRNYSFNNTFAVGFVPGTIANPELTWESTSKTDIGLELGFFQNRLTLEADYYVNKTRNLLVDIPLPAYTGFTTSLQNIGQISNRGFDLTLGADILTGRFKWNLQGSFSVYRNRVDKIQGNANDQINPGDVVFDTHITGGQAIVGEPVGVFYGWQYDGIFRTAQELERGPKVAGDSLGFARYVDLNRDSTINEKDRMIIGDPNPDFIFGLNSTFGYKNFSLTVFVNAMQGQDVFNAQRAYLISGSGNTLESYYREAWNGTSGTQPRPGANGLRPNSTYFVEDGSFVRLQNVVLKYTLPRLGKVFKNASVYVSAQNLYTFTKYSGYDPEINTFGQNNLSRNYDIDSYPRARTFMVGATIGF